MLTWRRVQRHRAWAACALRSRAPAPVTSSRPRCPPGWSFIGAGTSPAVVETEGFLVRPAQCRPPVRPPGPGQGPRGPLARSLAVSQQDWPLYRGENVSSGPCLGRAASPRGRRLPVGAGAAPRPVALGAAAVPRG